MSIFKAPNHLDEYIVSLRDDAVSLLSALVVILEMRFSTQFSYIEKDLSKSKSFYEMAYGMQSKWIQVVDHFILFIRQLHNMAIVHKNVCTAAANGQLAMPHVTAGMETSLRQTLTLVNKSINEVRLFEQMLQSNVKRVTLMAEAARLHISRMEGEVTETKIKSLATVLLICTTKPSDVDKIGSKSQFKSLADVISRFSEFKTIDNPTTIIQDKLSQLGKKEIKEITKFVHDKNEKLQSMHCDFVALDKINTKMQETLSGLRDSLHRKRSEVTQLRSSLSQVANTVIGAHQIKEINDGWDTIEKNTIDWLKV